MDTVNELTNSDKISVGASRMDIQPITLFRPIKLTRKKDVLNRLKNAQLVSSNYDVEASLKFVADDLFRLGTGYRFNVPKILILFVNGPQDALPANEAVKKLLENNVKVVTIGVGRKVTEADLLQKSVFYNFHSVAIFFYRSYSRKRMSSYRFNHRETRW